MFNFIRDRREAQSSVDCGEALFRTVGQFFFFYREYRIRFQFDVANDTDSTLSISKLNVIFAGLYTGDLQALVMIYASIGIVFALVFSPAVFAAWRQLKTGNRGIRQVPEPNSLATGGQTRCRSAHRNCNEGQSYHSHVLST